MDNLAVTKNYLYQTFQVFYKQWSISIDIMPIGIQSYWSNILHVGIGGNKEEYGDQTPAISFAPDTTKIRIASAINGNKNFRIDTDPIPINEWTQLEISQLRQLDGVYQFTIRIAGTIFTQINNTDPREFSEIKVYTSNNYRPAANAQIATLTISTFPDTTPISTESIDECTIDDVCGKLPILAKSRNDRINLKLKFR